MSVTAPVQADVLPLGPSMDDPDNFDALADPFAQAQRPFGIQMNALSINVYSNALDAQASAVAGAFSESAAASSAAAAAAASNAVKWVAGTYADGDAVWDPLNHLPYRCIGAGVRNTNPSLDAAHWAIQLLGLGMGGISLIGNVALTSTSPAAILVTPTGPGLYMYLPDATTCVKAALLSSVFNAGLFDYGVKDFAGNQIGWVRPNSGAEFGLVDNSSTAGVWAPRGVQKAGETAFLNVPSIADGVLRLKRVTIDSNRSLFLFAGCYAVVFDASTGNWGSPLLVRATGSFQMSGILASTDKVLVVTGNGSTGIEAVILSLTGTAITPNTPATATAAGVMASWGDLIAFGAGFAWSYTRATASSVVRAITVSGTTPTIGAEAVLGTGIAIPPVLFASGSVLRALGYDGGSGLMKCQPYSLSGASLSPGTAATQACDSSLIELRAFQNGNGNIIVLYNLSGKLRIATFSLSGTTESTGTPAAPFDANSVMYTDADLVSISGTKTAVIGLGIGGNAVQWNIHIDSAGVGSVGTPDAAVANAAAMAVVGATGNSARFVVSSATDVFAVTQIQFDCSGASPVRGSVQVRQGVNVPSKVRTGKDARHFSVLSAGGSQLAIGGVHALDGRFNANGIQAVPSLGISFIDGALGAAANESWILSGSPSSIGVTIKRIEAAA